MDNYIEKIQAIEKKSNDNGLKEAKLEEKKSNLTKDKKKKLDSLKEYKVSFDDLEEKIAELKIEIEEDIGRSEKELA